MKREIRPIAVLLAGAALAVVCVLGAAKPKTFAAQEDGSRLLAQKSLGSPNAPIKMVVFSDYQCPACGNFYEGTLRQLIDDYVASGKVYLVHRDFPLPMHQYSREAARWANAAARIGHFEVVDRALYDNQAAWSANGNMRQFVQAALTPSEFKRTAALMKGCESDSHDLLKGCAVDAGIERDIAAGHLVPVTQTPTFIISYKGQAYPPAAGGVAWPILRQFFDQLLNQK